LWLPYHGTGTVACVDAPYYGGGPTPVEPYAFWSNAAPSLGLGIDVREKGLDYAQLRRLLGQWRALSAYYQGDFWPLTSCSHDPEAWIGWQFDRPEQGDGVVQVFRRAASVCESARLPLRGVDPSRRYQLDRWDPPLRTEIDGAELSQRGLPVTIAARPAAVIVAYRALPASR